MSEIPEISFLSHNSRLHNTRNRGHHVSPSVRRLQEALVIYLNSHEQGVFHRILEEYQLKRNVYEFVQMVTEILDTPAKCQLLPLLRRFIPRSDVMLFDHFLRESQESSSLRLNGGTIYRTQSTLSMPAHHFGSLPGRRTPKKNQGMLSVKSLSPASCWDSAPVSEIKRVYIERAGYDDSWGFSIRGGAEHGIGIYVSYVDVDSVGERAGLVPGDQILQVNQFILNGSTHKDTAELIRTSLELDLKVRNVGRVPGSFETHQTYTWVNTDARPVSPPPEVDRTGRYEMAGERRSGLMLLKGSDERKVNVSVEDGRPLGIMVRGGNEFGLGIYITGVDVGSDAEQAELKLGDQILDVNGQSFLDISHKNAVKVLKSTKHLMMMVKDVGKLPHSRTTYDQAQWVKHKTPSRRPLSTHSTPAHKARPNRASVFSRGAGSQLMLSAVANQQTFMGLIREKAVHLLNRSELQTLSYYLEEYQQGHVTIDGLARALLQLLNTTAKFSLVADVRAIITAQDLDKFDSLLSKKSSTNLRKARSAEIVYQGPPSDQSLDSGASSRVSSLESAKSSSLASLLGEQPYSFTAVPETQVADGDMGRLHIAIRQMSNDSEDLPDTLQEAPTLHPAPGTSYQGVTMAEVHRIPERNGAESGASANSPSEDSGVEMNGHGEKQTSSRNKGPSKFHKGKSTPKRDNRTEENGWVDLREQSRRLSVKDSERLSKPLSVKVHNENLPSMQSRPIPSKNTSLGNPVGLLSIASDTAGVSTSYSKHLPEDDLSSAQSSPNSISQRIERYQQAAAASFKPDAVITKPVRPPKPQNTVTRNKYEHNWTSLSKITSPSTTNTQERESAVNSDSMQPGTKLVRVQKTKPTLGLAIEGGANTRQPLPRIIKVQPGGSANDTGELKIGHVILEVNGKSLDGLEHKTAARTIAAAFKDSNTDYIELLVTEPSQKVTV